MKLVYDRESDVLVIALRDDPIHESDEVRSGVIADFGFNGNVVRCENVDASKLVSDLESVEFVSHEAS